MSRENISVLCPDTEPVGDEAPDLESNVAEPFMCAGVSVVVAKRDGERGALLFLVVSPPFDIFFSPPARATLTDVNEARARFPGGIKAPLPADTARDLPLVCRRLCGRHRRLCFPQWSGITSVACPSVILIAGGTAATSAGDEL